MAINVVPISQFPSQEHYNSLRKLLRDSGYPILTNDQLWYYHAYDYGWRRVFLGQRNEVSPIDEDGQWFNGLMADRTEQFFRNRKDAGRDAMVKARDEELRREGRGLLNEWAQEQGYSDVDAYAMATGVDWADAYKTGAHAIIAARRNVFRGLSDERAFDAHRRLQERMGLSATESKPKYAPTPEEMAASRQQLGIDESDEMAMGRQQLGMEG